MPISILMPALSPTMTEGTLIKWHKKEGEHAKAGEVLAEIETDKASMEIECVDDGVIGKIMVEEATHNVQVGSIIAVMLEKGESIDDLQHFLTSSVGHDSVHSCVQQDLDKNTLFPKDATPQSTNEDFCVAQTQRIRISPLAKRMAKTHEIPLDGMKGSGPSGRIIKKDIESVIQTKTLNLSSRPSLEKEINETIQHVQDAAFHDTPLTTMRLVIGKRLSEAKQQIPHFYLENQVNVNELLHLRTRLNENPKAITKLSVNDFVLRATALALMDHPSINASFHGDFVRCYRGANISVAVAIEGGLITPIIEEAQQKSLTTISMEMKSLARQAKEMKLKPHQYQGGSFSVSNLGMFGTTKFQAIINPPQVAILAVGSPVDTLCLVNEQIVSYPMMTLCLSVDHRAVDGADAAQFLRSLKDLLHYPFSLLS